LYPVAANMWGQLLLMGTGVQMFLSGSILTDAIYAFCTGELLMQTILTPERSGHVCVCGTVGNNRIMYSLMFVALS
jgi:hypothetical protein